LRQVLRSPELMTGLSDREWGLLVGQARSSSLVARLAYILERHPLIESPAGARRHFEGERAVTEALAREVLRDIRQIADPLAEIGARIILLKGAAYVIGDLPPSRGRVFGDIDILVPRHLIPVVEQRLKAVGWESSELDAWDQRFYREWMHEIPPLAHSKTGTVVDVHHTIVPLTARNKLAANLLFDAAIPAALDRTLSILSPADMVLHSAVHLFNEGEFDRALRDLVDLDLLLRHFGQRTEFWDGLVDRSQALDLGRPLYYCLRYAHRFLGTPVPAAILARSARAAPAVPWLMDVLFERGLRPAHRSCRNAGTRLAVRLLYLRGHLLRLPLTLLIPHLLRKSFKRNVEVLQPLGRNG
jgi:hypothetical protein